MSWFNCHVSRCSIIFSLLLQEPTADVTKCLDNRHEAGDMIMRCEQDSIIHTIKIEVNLWRPNSGNNCEKINHYDMSNYNCKRMVGVLRENISSKCDGRPICRYTPRYRDWHNCPGKKDMPNRPIFLKFAFECASSKYILSCQYDIRTHVRCGYFWGKKTLH